VSDKNTRYAKVSMNTVWFSDGRLALRYQRLVRKARHAYEFSYWPTPFPNSGPSNGGLYVLALTTGMRQGELLALRWKDVDLEAASLSVRGTLTRSPDGLTVAEPKTTGSRRHVFLGIIAVDALRRHRVNQTAERLLKSPEWENNDLVFANEVGKPIEASNLRRRSFQPLLEKAGLPRIRFHDLRHSAATLLLTQGIHPKVVSERLGHSKVSITLDLYSHVTPTLQKEAAMALDALIAGSEEPLA